jgi:hypothetical protein
MKVRWSYVIASFVISIPIWVGVLTTPDLPEKSPWIPTPDTRDYGPINRKQPAKIRGTDYDWEGEMRRGSHVWDEFIEEIQQRGLDPWDPEAIEIWDKNYN